MEAWYNIFIQNTWLHPVCKRWYKRHHSASIPCYSHWGLGVIESLTLIEVSFNGKVKDGALVPSSRLETRIDFSLKLLSINLTAFSHCLYFLGFILFAFWQLPAVRLHLHKSASKAGPRFWLFQWWVEKKGDLYIFPLHMISISSLSAWLNQLRFWCSGSVLTLRICVLACKTSRLRFISALLFLMSQNKHVSLSQLL